MIIGFNMCFIASLAHSQRHGSFHPKHQIKHSLFHLSLIVDTIPNISMMSPTTNMIMPNIAKIPKNGSFGLLPIFNRNVGNSNTRYPIIKPIIPIIILPSIFSPSFFQVLVCKVYCQYQTHHCNRQKQYA